MVKRSLQGSLTGIEQAKKAFAQKGWTQDNLAFEVNLRLDNQFGGFLVGVRLSVIFLLKFVLCCR